MGLWGNLGHPTISWFPRPCAPWTWFHKWVIIRVQYPPLLYKPMWSEISLLTFQLHVAGLNPIEARSGNDMDRSCTSKPQGKQTGRWNVLVHLLAYSRVANQFESRSACSHQTCNTFMYCASKNIALVCSCCGEVVIPDNHRLSSAWNLSQFSLLHGRGLSGLRLPWDSWTVGEGLATVGPPDGYSGRNLDRNLGHCLPLLRKNIYWVSNSFMIT